MSTHSLYFMRVLCCERSSCCPSIILRFAWNSLESSTSTSSWEESPLCFKNPQKKCDYLTCSVDRRIENEEGLCLNISLGLDFRFTRWLYFTLAIISLPFLLNPFQVIFNIMETLPSIQKIKFQDMFPESTYIVDIEIINNQIMKAESTVTSYWEI